MHSSTAAFWLYYLLLIARCLLWGALLIFILTFLPLDFLRFHMIVAVPVLIVLSVPFSAAALFIAFGMRLITSGYVALSFLLCLILPLGMAVIPFMLWRDLWMLAPDQRYGRFESLLR